MYGTFSQSASNHEKLGERTRSRSVDYRSSRVPNLACRIAYTLKMVPFTRQRNICKVSRAYLSNLRVSFILLCAEES